MTQMKDKLDALRIERSEETGSGSRRGLVLAAAALLVLAAAGWWALRPRPAEVRVATAREVSAGGGAATVLNASGYVTARRQATVSSKVTGKVLEVLIEEGMAVAEGDVLARLDASNVGTSLRLNEAELVAARSDLEEIRVRLAKAELDLDRAERLAGDRIASQESVDAAQAEVNALEARRDSQLEEIRVAERRLGVIRQQFEDTVIRAPFAGVIVAKNAQPGEMISPTSAGGGFTRTGIGTIVDMTSLEIEVDVNEAYINRVAAGQRVVATLDAYPDWKIPTRVIAIIPTADRQKATVQVRVGFDQLDPRILPDMGVKVAFQGAETPAVGAADVAGARRVRVPGAAVVEADGRDVVFVVAGDRLERRAVTVAGGDEAGVDIEAGLSAGESVVLEPPSDLEDGERVRIAEEAE